MFNSAVTACKTTFTTIGVAALSCVLLGVFVKPANAATSCYGSEYYVSCTSTEYDYASGKMITCYGSGSPNYINWSCTSF